MAAARIPTLVNGVTEILKKLSSDVAYDEFKDDCRHLQSTLYEISAVMEDVERKQVRSPAVRLWIEDLKSIAYDGKDILDEYYYEIIRTETEKVRKSSLFFSWRMSQKIMEINKKFKKTEKLKNGLGLNMMMNRETNSLLVGWKFVGRENDKSTIIKMLLKEEEENSSNQGGGKHVSVIPIVGMGGLGKTTMAQLVYNDEAVNRHFDIKLWICVSRGPFDIKKLWKNIANSIGIAKQHDDAMADIARWLQDALRGKKFILVLDDVWNEDPEEWYKFKNPFMVGREGSKMLVTTRSENVALIMVDKFLPYRLGMLNEKDCWYLFKEITFGSAAGVEETPNLVEIGKEMVYRCKGLPLAVIFLGSLMRSKKTEEEWKNIRDDILRQKSHELHEYSFRSSYDNLPLYLKLCFSYCCLFPRDWEIKRERLIQLWVADGMVIHTPEENIMSMEEIGNEYFHSLLSSFFFQDVEKDEDGDIATCKMNGIVHDLARSVVKNHECLIVENATDIDFISEATRRLSLLVNLDDEEMLAKVLEALKKAKNLRTIFVNNQTIRFDIGNAFQENKRLRVINLSGSDVKIASTSSIGGLHLRYLDVEGACFPKGMIGRLSFLQTLTEFNLGDKKENKNASSVIEELEDLNLLTGDLSINNLQNVTSGIDACRANLKEKNLGVLKLSWYGRYANNNDEDVLEGLRPHPNLRILEINGFDGAKLPRWIEDAGFGAFLSLGSLTLNGLYKLKCLTIAFPSLKNLILEDMQSLKEWVVRPPSTTTSICFPLLEEINIRYCPRLSIITPTTTIFPSLKVLYLHDVDGRAAETLVTNNLNSLTSLRLFEIKNLVSLPRQGLMQNNNTLLSLHIEDCPQFKGFLRRLPNKEDEDNEEDDDQEGGGQQLQQKISEVVSSSSSSSSSLQSLTLYDCPALRFYPNIRSLTSLQTLEIQECKESKSLLTCLSSSSSSSSSSLEHLEYVQIVKNKTAAAVVYEWKKSEFLKD